MRDDRLNTPRIVVVGLGKRTAELFSFFLAISPTIIVARTLLSRQLFNKLLEDAGLTLDSVVLSDDAFQCTYFVNVARGGGGMGIMELGLELQEKRCRG